MKLIGFLWLLLPAALIGGIGVYVAWAAPKYRKMRRRRDLFAPLDNNPWW